jgi:hypothetical protein
LTQTDAAKKGAHMSGSPWRRTVAASLVVVLCVLALPATSHAAVSSWDSFDHPAFKLWARVLEWVTSLWPGLDASSRLPNDGKFGAGHSNDGLAKAKGAKGAF